jgi:putative membrane protein
VSNPPPDPNRDRDHLANERTFLAWVRTSVALMGFGVVIVRLRYLLPSAPRTHGHGWELGLLFTLVGLLTVPLATLHYFAVRRAIEAGGFEPSSRWVILLAIALLLVGAGVLAWLFNSPAAMGNPAL